MSSKPRTLYDGDTFDHRGRTFKVAFPRDEDMGTPWEEHDGHGIVSEWTTRAKWPEERVLAEDGRQRRYYDIAETMRIARRDGWGTADGRRPGETARAYAARAVEADFEYCRRWCADAWEWCGVVVTLLDEEGEPTKERESLWGIESDSGEYLTETAYELADEIMSRVEVDEPIAVRGEN